MQKKGEGVSNLSQVFSLNFEEISQIPAFPSISQIYHSIAIHKALHRTEDSQASEEPAKSAMACLVVKMVVVLITVVSWVLLARLYVP